MTIPTKWTIFRVDGTKQEFSGELHREPGYDTLKIILDPLLNGGHLEHVSVWADYAGGEKYQALDMFVDEDGHSKDLPRNEMATTIYRRATMEGKTGVEAPKDPEELSFCVGPAILFSRRVWF